ncbi:MAG: hypothetical protein ABIT71_01470 [Vicinamibacteraceae bacterium]
MTDTPASPPPAPIEPPVTPVGPPPVSFPPSLPPGTPAGRPRIAQAALLFVAFGVIAGGSFAAFLGGFAPAGSNDLWSLLFVLSVPLAAGAFALLVFRLWRRRFAEAWPSVGQALLMGLAGSALAIGGCGGWAATLEASEIWPVAMALGAVFVAGTALAVGAGELFFVALARLIVSPRK